MKGDHSQGRVREETSRTYHDVDWPLLNRDIYSDFRVDGVVDLERVLNRVQPRKAASECLHWTNPLVEFTGRAFGVFWLVAAPRFSDPGHCPNNWPAPSSACYRAAYRPLLR